MAAAGEQAGHEAIRQLKEKVPEWTDAMLNYFEEASAALPGLSPPKSFVCPIEWSNLYPERGSHRRAHT